MADDLFPTRKAPSAENEAAAQQGVDERRRYERQHRCSENWKLQWAQRNEAPDVDTKTDSAHKRIDPQLEQRYLSSWSSRIPV
jgi:hypothetical protein